MRERMARDVNNDNFIAKSIALFFFVNILLCMIGTFYLRTRKRSEEAGVMRSFGASRGFIIREMLGEGFAMVTRRGSAAVRSTGFTFMTPDWPTSVSWAMTLQ